MENQVTNTDAVFSVKADSTLALQIALTMEKAKKHGKDKGHFSIEYFCEEMLSEKLDTYSNYLDADEDRKNRELFVKAMNALHAPDDSPESAMAYISHVNNLKRKYRQGESKPKGGL